MLTSGQKRKKCWFHAGLLIFRAVTEPSISSKSAKSRGIHKNTGNPVKFARNLTKYIFESYLGCCSCLLAVNLLIYLETSSLQSANNIPKLLSILGVDRGNWGWECDSLFHRVHALCEECCVLWRITLCTFISPTKMRIFFGTVRSTNDKLQNEQSSCSFSCSFVLQKHCDYRLEKQTIMLRSVPQMLKKWRIIVNRM